MKKALPYARNRELMGKTGAHARCCHLSSSTAAPHRADVRPRSARWAPVSEGFEAYRQVVADGGRR